MNRIALIAGVALVTASVTAAVIVVFNRRQAEWDRQVRDSSKSMPKSPYSGLIAEKLVEYSGEASPIVHAFEEALEVETRLERQLARETGLEA